MVVLCSLFAFIDIFFLRSSLAPLPRPPFATSPDQRFENRQTERHRQRYTEAQRHECFRIPATRIGRPPQEGQRISYCTPEFTKMSIHGKLALDIHWKMQPTSTEKATTLWNVPLNTWKLVGKYRWASVGKCYWIPQWFLRSRFLVCRMSAWRVCRATARADGLGVLLHPRCLVNSFSIVYIIWLTCSLIL